MLALAPKYHKAFLNPADESFHRLECPPPKSGKYDYLQSQSRSLSQRKFFFAINLHDSIDILPRLIGSVIEAIQFLGASQCALSIIEGRSEDGTYEILHSLTPVLESVGIQFYFSSSPRDPHGAGSDRVATLAALRNEALEPLIKHQDEYSRDTTIIFLNDVAICMEDILELIHQRINLGADMTCGMDWKNLWVDPTFYDVWIARDMNGDSFFEIGEDGNWDSAWKLFWNNAESKQKFEQHRPFQVFSCWNGGAAFTARPFLEKRIAFRGPREGECYQGEPTILCKEMWYLGYGKIAVVPTVNLEYSDDGARKIKELRGTVSGFPPQGGDTTLRFDWISKPPDMVRCITNYDNQTWRPWNESLGIEDPTAP